MTELVVEGRDAGGGVLVRDAVRHGEHPEQTLWRNGFRPVDFVDVVASDGGDTLAVVAYAAPVTAADRPPPTRVPERDPGLRLAPGERAVPVQRLAAYAVVVGPAGILLTQLSERTNAAGSWGLPGGGLEPGETPAQALRREVTEESGQDLEVGDLLGVLDARWIGRAPDGRLEDFHVVRLVYRGACPHPTEPVVLDRGGTTAAAAWVRPGDLGELPIAPAWASVLMGLGAAPG